LLDSERSGARSQAALAAVAQVGVHLVRTGSQAGGVDVRGGVIAGDFQAGAGPGVFDGAFGIEIGAGGARSDRFAGEKFDGFQRAGSGSSCGSLAATPHEIEARLKTETA
jgi:hypothetical protein